MHRPAEPGESYLDQVRILSAALASGTQAIHPGYGFLSENAAFSALCQKYQIAFIGPSAQNMQMLSDKAAVKALMQQAGLPVIPGALTLHDAASVRTAAEKIGYPVMLKACMAAAAGASGSSRARPRWKRRFYPRKKRA